MDELVILGFGEDNTQRFAHPDAISVTDQGQRVHRIKSFSRRHLRTGRTQRPDIAGENPLHQPGPAAASSAVRVSWSALTAMSRMSD